MSFPPELWKKIAMDVVGPFKSANWDCRYALTLVDYHSKWPEFAFVSSVSAKKVINFLTSVLSCHGNSESIVTDNGPQFTAALFSAFLRVRDMAHVSSDITLQPKTGCPLKLSRVGLVSTWVGDILGKRLG